VLLALPLLLLRRRFDVVVSAVMAGALLIVVSTAAMPTHTFEYLTEVMPRLVRHGINPPPGTMLPSDVLASLFQGYPAAIAHAHGQGYVRFALSFDDHASLVWALAGEQAKYPGLLSLLVTGLMVGGVALALRRRASAMSSATDDLAWLVLALCCVLLAAPLTWPMNMVWLLPAVFVVLARSDGDTRGLFHRHGTVIGILGLVLVALPDRYSWPWPRPLHWVSSHKYVLGAMAVAVAMIVRLASSRQSAAASDNAIAKSEQR
jgi:hypothetical protein